MEINNKSVSFKEKESSERASTFECSPLKMATFECSPSKMATFECSPSEMATFESINHTYKNMYIVI